MLRVLILTIILYATHALGQSPPTQCGTMYIPPSQPPIQDNCHKASVAAWLAGKPYRVVCNPQGLPGVCLYSGWVSWQPDNIIFVCERSNRAPLDYVTPAAKPRRPAMPKR